MFTKTCLKCQGSFGTNLDRSIYCSKYCRERAWRHNNPQRSKEHSKAYALKQKLICKYCTSVIPNSHRKSGVTHCSDKCSSDHRKTRNREYLKKAMQRFHEFKISLGCCLCGYSVYAGSLDFHHKDPSKKDSRIDPKQWISGSELGKKELAKCVLVCKNCHHELHDLMRKDLKGYWQKIGDKL